MYPWAGLPTKPALVGTRVCCLLRDRGRAALFLSCAETEEGKPRASLGKPLVFHLRYASQVPQTLSQHLNRGNYRAFSLSLTAVPELKPTLMSRIHTQNYGELVWKPQFHTLEHGSEMRLLKTHSLTSPRQGNEAGNVRQNCERKEGLALRGRDNSSRKAIVMPPATTPLVKIKAGTPCIPGQVCL